MAAIEDDTEAAARPLKIPPLDFIACAVGVTGLIALTIVTIRWPQYLSPSQSIGAFIISCVIPFAASWREAVRDGRLPAMPNGTPKHDHITGTGFITLAFVIGVIVGLASWAATSTDANRTITQEWGIGVVFGLAIAFVIAALAPYTEYLKTNRQADAQNGFWTFAGRLFLRPFGLVLSFFDSILVFAVAGSAGASQAHLIARYFFLFGVLIPCGMIGYFLPAPWGLVPVVWGFVVAISISRRWSWVEDDRDLYMLNRRYTGSHLRIGFGQDLRDEALLSFMSMFFLVPLALRQAFGWSQSAGVELFSVTGVGIPSLLDWIGFYGTELAKAVPFVDWAEIYHVEGQARIHADTAFGRHLIFATRVLVDLVFLAALLQALSISARNSKQMDLFLAGTMDRLDPFLEPREFRKLLRKPAGGQWEIHPDRMAAFPKYDPLRLAELSDAQHYPISIAAKALRRRDGSDDSVKFHEQLIERAFQKKKNPDAIEEVLTAIRMTNVPIEIEDFDRIRIELNGRRAMNSLRETIMKMIAAAADTPERWAALKSALTGETEHDHGRGPEYVRDHIAPVRRTALNAVKDAALAGSDAAVSVIRSVHETDPSGQIKREAGEILIQLAKA
ncbi:MAG: hypothetical protein ABW199_04400 [Caulobacterales bacterium]